MNIPRTTRLRVLVIAPSLDILGGQAVQAEQLVSRLKEIDSLDVGFLPINPRLPGGLRKLQSVKYLRTIVTSLAYIVSLFSRVPTCDVLHVFSASYFSFVLAPTPAILIGKLFRKRIVLNYHSGEAQDHLTRWPSARNTLRLVDRIVVPSQYLVRVFRGFGLEAEAINNIVELSAFTFKERKQLRPIFLSNRNFESHYGVDDVLRAFGIIQSRYPDAQLIVAGDGSQRDYLQSLAAELGLRQTTFVGRVEHDRIAELYHQADIYLNGSSIDNQPLSILEAFASGMPIVTTGPGGIPDMICDGHTGFVVPCADDAALAARAIELLENQALAQRFAAAGLSECTRYSWDAVKHGWINVYHRVGSLPQKKSKLAKLASMSLDEFRERISQRLAIEFERRAWTSLSKFPSDNELSDLLKAPTPGEALLQQFRAATTPTAFEVLADPRAAVSNFKARWEDSFSTIVAEADNIVAGRFNLLGQKNLSFGDPIDWRLEPFSEKTTPLIHWSLIDYLDPDIAGDKKITWELNRHQHFIRLGQAYWLTGNEKYAKTFVEHLESWMEANPPKQGINLCSSLEVAFRSISWLWSLQLFKQSPSLTAATFTRALKFLYLNARHLETYLSTYFSPNTHLTGEALGLYYLGTLLPKFREADRWSEKGKRILLEQLPIQVRADGVYFEQSSYYQRYTADFYTHFLILARANADPIEPYVEEKLQALLDHLMYITRPDGTTPFYGDDDGGRLLPLDQTASNDFRSTLSTAAVLFHRGDYKFVAEEFAQESFWLLGPAAAETFDTLIAHTPKAHSKAFRGGGYYVMRDGWSNTSNYLLFDCGPHGSDNCGHAHADALSIELAANGRTILVDPGTYTYTGELNSRNHFRGSPAHNTLTIDGESSSVPDGPFSWQTVAKCELSSWINERRFDFVEGRHDGYERVVEPASHTRGILFLKNDYWIVRDRVSSIGEHQLALTFQFDAGLEIAQLQRHHGVNLKNSKECQFSAVSFGLNGSWNTETGAVSHCYSTREDAAAAIFSASSTGDSEVITFLLPFSLESSEQSTVREVEAIGGRAFELHYEEHRDLVMFKATNSPRVETVRSASNFNCTWARFSSVDAELPEELVVIDGNTLELDGIEILKSAHNVSYLAASRMGSKFRFETREGHMDFTLPVRNLETLFTESRQQA